MFTLRLWKALCTPTQHTLFRYLRTSVLSQKTVAKILDDIIHSNVIFELITIALVIGACVFACIFSVALFALLPLIIPVIGTYFALNNALKIGSMLTREYRTQRYTLLTISPIGISGTHWFIANIVCTSNHTISNLISIVRVLFYLILVGAGIVLCQQIIINIDSDPMQSVTDVIFITIPFTLLIVMIVIDFIQSNVLGCILSMFVPLYIHKEIEASGLILGVFLLMQFLFYLLVGVMLYATFIITNGITESLTIQEAFLVTGFTLTTALITAFGMREVFIWQFWRYLMGKLEADSSDLKHIMGTVA